MDARCALVRRSVESESKSKSSISISSIAHHLGRALKSCEPSSEPVRLFRTLDDSGDVLGDRTPSYAAVQSCKLDPLFTSKNCHNGQRKLAFALLEFLALKHKRNQKAVLVYAGASAPAMAVAREAFPKLPMIAFDPNPNLVGLMPKDFAASVTIIRDVPWPEAYRRIAEEMKDSSVFVCTGRNGWFDDAVARKLQEVCVRMGGRRILFASDVRSSNREEEIAKDMVSQARWARLLQCAAFTFKFRVPYRISPDIVRVYGPARISASTNTNTLTYTRGKMHIQLYARPKTAELRLIGDDPSLESEYDMRMIEDRMALFNMVYRSFAIFGKPGKPYETACEDQVIADFTKDAKRRARIKTLLEASSQAPHKRDVFTCSERM